MKNYILDTEFLNKNNINEKNIEEVLLFLTLGEVKEEILIQTEDKKFSDENIKELTINSFNFLKEEADYSEFLENFRYEIPFELNAHKKNTKRNRFYCVSKDFLDSINFVNFYTIEEKEATSYLITKEDLKKMILETYESNDIKFTDQKLNRITNKTLDKMFEETKEIKKDFLKDFIKYEIEIYK